MWWCRGYLPPFHPQRPPNHVGNISSLVILVAQNCNESHSCIAFWLLWWSFILTKRYAQSFWGKVWKIIKIERVIPHLHGEDGLSFFFTTQLADAECGVDVSIALHHKMMLQKLCYARKITVLVTFMTDDLIWKTFYTIISLQFLTTFSSWLLMLFYFTIIDEV